MRIETAELAAAALTAYGRCRKKDLMEKRENKRHDSDTAVRCSFLTTLRCGEPVDGIMKNYGCGGMYAELRAHFKAGTILVVRSTGSPSGCPNKDGYRSMSLAEVKW